jgi:hypothetical protein
MTPLTATPDLFRKIIDDTEAKAFLVEFGLLEKLLEHRREHGLPGPWAASAYYTTHPTHWIIATRLEGFANPADNGYVLDCLPKSQCSFERFRLLAVANADDTFPDGPATFASEKPQPPQN